jgi:hypothetical protein
MNWSRLMIDLRDEKNFEAALADCVTSQQIQNLVQERGVQLGIASRDAGGVLHGTDERLDPSSDLVGDDCYLVGDKLLTLRGTSGARNAMRARLRLQGLDVSKLQKYEG